MILDYVIVRTYIQICTRAVRHIDCTAECGGGVSDDSRIVNIHRTVIIERASAARVVAFKSTAVNIHGSVVIERASVAGQATLVCGCVGNVIGLVAPLYPQSLHIIGIQKIFVD